MLVFDLELEAVAAANSWFAPVEGVGEGLNKECLPHCIRRRNLESEQLLGLFGAEIHHAAAYERQAERREGPGYLKGYKHVVVAETLQNISSHVNCRGLSAIKVDHAGRHYRFLGAAVENRANTLEIIGEDH